LGIEEIPSIGQILGKQLRHNTIPTERSVGAPFWTLFDLETGAPFGSGQEDGDYALLFWSRNQAEKYHAGNRLEAKWQVRGLKRVIFIPIFFSSARWMDDLQQPHRQIMSLPLTTTCSATCRGKS
jgi:hypothetical protein